MAYLSRPALSGSCSSNGCEDLLDLLSPAIPHAVVESVQEDKGSLRWTFEGPRDPAPKRFSVMVIGPSEPENTMTQSSKLQLMYS